MKIYQEFTHEKFCSGDIQIEIIEEVVVKDIHELHNIEKRYIQCEINNLNCLNSNMIEITEEERNEYYKTYGEKNKDKNSFYQHQHYEKNKEKIQQKHNEYYQTHKENVSEKGKRYYENVLRNKRQEKVMCECGTEVTNGSLNSHKKSQQHQQLMNELNNN